MTQRGGARSRGGAVVKLVATLPKESVRAGRATERQVLVGESDGALGFAMRRFIMGPGGGMPRHTNSVEHEQYVLRGKARVGIGDRVFEVGPDTALFIPAGEPHYYEVIEAPFEFLCVVPSGPDRIEIAPAEAADSER